MTLYPLNNGNTGKPGRVGKVDPPEGSRFQHGTFSFYRHGGCRCVPCKLAARAADAARKVKARPKACATDGCYDPATHTGLCRDCNRDTRLGRTNVDDA